jgi:phosphoribosylaminoimidazolecarboxamide formyltransferase/IMP cyclohydrolase
MGQVKTAVISVYNKGWVTNLASFLSDEGVEVFASGGTLRQLKSKKIKVNPIEKLTGGQEILDGRVKTLGYQLYAGLLANRQDAKHRKTLNDLGIRPIDLVAVNFYPFIEKVKSRTKMGVARELVDIGGVTLVRAAAKNYENVIVLVDPADYKDIISEWKQNEGTISSETRLKLAAKAFSYCREYDQAIEDYFKEALEPKKRGKAALKKPAMEMDSRIELSLKSELPLRYGENPHQRAALYIPSEGVSVPFKVLHGKKMSYNNFQDAAGAFRLCRMPYEKPYIACVLKHVNPCGVAMEDKAVAAIVKAKEGDPVSAYGGILGTNFEIGEAEAKEIGKTFLEVVVAPKFTPEAARLLSAKKKLRLLEIGMQAFEVERQRVIDVNEGNENAPLVFARIPYGFLVQEEDLKLLKPNELEVVSDVPLRPKYKPDVFFGTTIIRFLKSNSIAIFKDGMMVGAGFGQPSRVDAAHIAVKKAGKRASGAVLVSDAFFPFADSVEVAQKAVIEVLVAPSGSIRDHEVIDRANALKLCMVFIPDRHFLH